MQVLVAFAGAGWPEGTPTDGAARVEARYASRWATPPQRREATSATAGILSWQSRPVSRWPDWVEEGRDTVASLYTPLGYERVVAAEPLASAPVRLARELDRRPAAVESICPPFVSARLDAAADALSVHTDTLGLGRLFEVRTSWGWVWSNRPEAALAFAGLPPRADETGWAHLAVADEMFGHVTPYAGVTAVDAGTHLAWDGRAVRLGVTSIDTVASWASPNASTQSEQLIEAAAHDLAGVAASVTRLFPDRPVVDLTGGRDSRLVAAAFLAAGADVTLHTHDALPGDLEVARDLVALLDDPPEHRIRHVPTGGVGQAPAWEAMANATAWHAFAEGLRPCTYLHYRAPERIDGPEPLTIGGAGGEVAHGYFYPALRADLERLPLPDMIDAFADVVLQRFAPVAGAHPDARALVRERLRVTLGDIAARGYRDATLLDVFYLRERVRRWSSAGERGGLVAPLLAPSFVRAGLALEPSQRAANTLPRELTRRLLPRWADVPYYPGEVTAPAAARRPTAPRVVRLADAGDRDAVNSLLQDEEAWAGSFDTSTVHGLWSSSIAGRTTAPQERILRGVVWRGAFGDRLADLAGEARTRPVVPWVPVPETEEEAAGAADAASDPAPATPGRTPATPEPAPRPAESATRGGGSPTRRSRVRDGARRLARTRLWQGVRGTAAGRFVRAGATAARRRGIPL